MVSGKTYFKNLDGLRFIAFLCVFFAHSFYSEDPMVMTDQSIIFLRSITERGVLGVNFFFVLSGFLITYLLEIEKSENGKINIKNFYVRRTLRIWPLYYLIVCIGFLIIPFVSSLINDPIRESANFWYYLLFINNYDQPPSTAVLGILWSIAIEEQFYLFWPLLMVLFSRSNKNLLFFSIILISFLWRLVGNPGYTETLTCINDMSVGGWFAYMVIKYPSFKEKICALDKIAIVFIYMLTIIFVFHDEWWISLGPFARASYRFILSVLFGAIILEQNYAKNSIFKMEKSRWLTKWGTYTYGLYMLHFVSIYLIGKIIRSLIPTSVFHVIFTETIFTFLFSLILAYFSFHLFESYFLKMKKKFTSI